MDLPTSFSGWLRILYVVFAFCSALCLGALKGSPFPFLFSFIVLFFFISLQLLVSSIYGVFCFVVLSSNLSVGFFLFIFHVNFMMGSSNIYWFFIKCCRFTCGSYCWSNTGNRECWGNSWYVSCTCCLDILQPYKVITFQTPF